MDREKTLSLQLIESVNPYFFALELCTGFKFDDFTFIIDPPEKEEPPVLVVHVSYTPCE